MKHDMELVKSRADKELLALGQDRIVYLALLEKETVSGLMPQMEQSGPEQDFWGVYGANGDLVAICDSPGSAFEFATENGLIAVPRH